MTDDEPKHPSVRLFTMPSFTGIASSTIVATVTLTYGSSIWKTPTLPNRPPPEHPVYSLVGQVASNWAHVDHMLDILIWELADVDAQAGACITAQIAGTYGRFKAVIALLAFHQQRTNKSLKPLIDKATELSQKANAPGEKRHRTVHDPWYEFPSTSDQTAQFKAMPQKDLRYGIHPIDLKDIEDALEDIRKFSDRVEAFRSDVLATLVTSPGKCP
jgi:hypothetical protein